MEKRERHALLMLLGLGLLGHGVRLLYPVSPGSAAATAFTSADLGTGLDRQRARSAALARPVTAGNRIDLNAAGPADIARLPRVGPGLARKIVEARTEWGAFVSLADLDAVSGVGPVLLATIDSLVTLGDTIRAQAKRTRAGKGPTRSSGSGRSGAAGEGVPAVRIGELSAMSRGPAVKLSPGRRINVNSASEKELTSLRGIGTARARAIVAYRQANGPFASIKELEKVPGISDRLVRQLAPQVTIR